MIKQRGKTDTFIFFIPKYLDVCAMAVSIQNEEVDYEHLVNIWAPSLANAKFQRRFSRKLIQGIVFIQRGFIFPWLLKVFGRAEVSILLFPVHKNRSVDELIAQMVNAENGQEAIHNQLVHTLVADYTKKRVIVGKLIVQFMATKF